MCIRDRSGAVVGERGVKENKKVSQEVGPKSGKRSTMADRLYGTPGRTIETERVPIRFQ